MILVMLQPDESRFPEVSAKITFGTIKYKSNETREHHLFKRLPQHFSFADPTTTTKKAFLI